MRASAALVLLASLWGGVVAGAQTQGQGPLVEDELPTWTPGEQALIEGLRQVRTEELDLGGLPAELIAVLAERAGTAPELLDLGLEILEGESVPSVDSSSEQHLSLVQEALILEVFAGAREGIAIAARDRYLAQVRKDAWLQDPEAPLDPDGARTALLVSGALGRPQDVALLIDLAPLEPEHGGPFERALTRSLRSDPECFERLRGAWLGGGDEVAAACIAAVGAAGDSRALVFLEDVMRWSELLRPNAAGAVQAIGRGLDAERNESLALYLVDLLDPSQPQVCRAAAQALGSLGAEVAYAPLIDLLEHEDARLREGALWASAPRADPGASGSPTSAPGTRSAPTRSTSSSRTRTPPPASGPSASWPSSARAVGRSPSASYRCSWTLIPPWSAQPAARSAASTTSRPSALCSTRWTSARTRPAPQPGKRSSRSRAWTCPPTRASGAGPSRRPRRRPNRRGERSRPGLGEPRPGLAPKGPCLERVRRR